MDYLQSNIADVKKIEVGEVPALLVTPKQHFETKGSILFYHGWGSSKEKQVFRANIFAAYGYETLLPDARFHGQRGNLDYEDEDVARKYMLQTILHNIEEAPSLFRYMEEELQAKKMILAGHSMGAITAGGLFTYKRSIDGAMLFNGCSNWEFLVEEINRSKEGQIPYEELRINDFMLDNNPMDQVEAVADRLLIMLHGEEDTIVNPEAQREYYEKAKKVYKDPNKIIYETFEATDHQLTTQMLERALILLHEFGL